MKDNQFLVNNGLSKGENTYLWSVAQVYDISREKKYKEYQIKHLVIREAMRGNIEILMKHVVIILCK